MTSDDDNKRLTDCPPASLKNTGRPILCPLSSWLLVISKTIIGGARALISGLLCTLAVGGHYSPASQVHPVWLKKLHDPEYISNKNIYIPTWLPSVGISSVTQARFTLCSPFLPFLCSLDLYLHCSLLIYK